MSTRNKPKREEGAPKVRRSSDRPGDAIRDRATVALLFLGTFLLFSRAVAYGFVNYDDPAYVTENPHVQAGLTWAGMAWAFTGATDYWHPLPWLSHMLDWELFGANAPGHHLTSIVWHSLNGALVFVLFRRLTLNWGMSLVIAALFAWHPLRVESVVWITERKDVMSGTFFLLTLLAYGRYAAAASLPRQRRRAYGIALAAFVAGLMCKPMLVTVPLILLVLDAWPFRRGHATSLREWMPLLREKLPFFAFSGVIGIVTVIMQRHEGAFVLDLPWTARVGNALVSMLRYLGKFVWPAELSVCYVHPGAWPALWVTAASLAAVTVSAVAWHQRHTRPWIAAGWAWFVIMLLPVCGLVQVGFQAMADRYTYLPMLGVTLALVPTLWPPGGQAGKNRLFRFAAAAAAVVVAGLLVMTTWVQQGVWRDSISLFSHAVRVEPQSDIAHDFLASACYAAGRLDEAAAHADRARSLNPRNATAAVTLAGVREQQGRIAEAAELLRGVLALQPDDALVQCQLGWLELRRGDSEEARRLLLPALSKDASLRVRTLNLALGALEQGQTDAAELLAGLLLEVAPEDGEAHAIRGRALLARGNLGGALDHLRQAVARGPSSAATQLALARCSEQLGQHAEASRALDQALTLGADDAVIQLGAAELHARRGELARAVERYQRAAALAPGDANIHAALGYLLIATGDRTAGIAAWRRALELDPDFPGLRDRLRQQEGMR